MKNTLLLACFLLFGVVIFPGVSFAVGEGLPTGMKPLKRDTTVPLTKSECQSLGGRVEHEGEQKYCGGKGMCVVEGKDSVYGSCVTAVKPGVKPKAKTDKTQ